jgi:hypothetical protein
LTSRHPNEFGGKSDRLCGTSQGVVPGSHELRKLLFDWGDMKLKIMQVILTTAAVIIFTLAAPLGFAQQDTQGKPTAKGQMKEGGKQTGKAGKSLGHNVKHGRIARGGKQLANGWATPAGT